MLQLLIGKKGSGKTKQLIEKVNAAAGIAAGNVVFVSDNTGKNMYDIKSNVRMIDTSEFSVTSYDKLYGFICGIISGNFDITDLFVDGVLRMVDSELDGLEEFIKNIDSAAAKHGTNVIMSVSVDSASAPEYMKKYL